MAWFPEDANSLPTHFERTLATEAIDMLEKEVEQTLAAADQLEQELQETRAKTEQIRHEIFKRVIWLAPIRRIPADVLSLLFIQACQDDWKAPLVLGAVCRRWRNVLIDTPRAWASIQITPSCRLPHHELLDLWLSRCGALKIDVSLRPQTSSQTVEVVSRYARNLRCLSFFGNAGHLQGQYTQLEELRLGPEFINLYQNFFPHHGKMVSENGGEPQADGEDRSPHAFPKLVSLHLHTPSPGIMEAIAHNSLFPSLQKLHIHASGDHWLRIIQCCADLLTALTIEKKGDVVDTAPRDGFDKPILLPQLQDLHFVRVDTTSHWPSFQTPNLKYYHEHNGVGVSPIHRDVSTVTSLLLHNPEIVEWSNFPSLTHLRIRDEAQAILQEITVLMSDESLCPKLHSVECIVVASETCEPLITASVASRSVRTGTAIDFRYTAVGYDPKQENPHVSHTCWRFLSSHLLQCFTFCHSHARQDQPYWDPCNEGFNVLDDDEESEGHHDYEYDDYEDYDSEDRSDGLGNYYDTHDYSFWY
jgi:hypothetical protein